MDRATLIEEIKSRNIDYSSPISAETLSSILYNVTSIDWDSPYFIEELRPDAGEGEDAYCYIDYYDENAWAIIMVRDIWRELNSYRWSPDCETDEELADIFLWWEAEVNAYRKEFLKLKEK